MLLSTKIMFLSHTSCYYQQKSCYYQTPCAIIHETYVIIVLVLLSDTSTTHVIIKHMLLSDTSCFYQTPHVIIKQIMILFNNSCHCQTPHVIINISTKYPYTSINTMIYHRSPRSSLRNWFEHSLSRL